MRVFISWSGEPSRSIARELAQWLESVLPQVDTWMSDEEIGSGAPWSDAIANALDKTDFGIVCVTRQNRTAPWLIFEAGALAKSVRTARVVPLCVDLLPSDITGPLARFQSRSLGYEGIRRLVHDLNKETEKPLSSERLDRTFDTAWPQFEAAFAEVFRVPLAPDLDPQRETADMLAEIVDSMRRIEHYIFDIPPPPDEPGAGTTVDNGESVDLVAALRASVEAARARRAEAWRAHPWPSQGA